MRKKVVAFCFTIFIFLTASPPSNAAYVYNIDIFNSANYGSDPTLSFEVEAFDLGEQVKFEFRNNSTASSVVTQIFFDSDLSWTFDHLTNEAGTMFEQDIDKLKNFPAGNTLTPTFEPTDVFLADQPSPQWGIGIGEKMQIVFNLGGGVDFSDVTNALSLGTDLRIGMHIQCLGYNGEDSVAAVTPEPATITLFGLACLGIIRRRSNRV